MAGKGYQKNATGNRYNNGQQRDHDDEDNQEQDSFHCHDDAGYDDVNQVSGGSIRPAIFGRLLHCIGAPLLVCVVII